MITLSLQLGVLDGLMGCSNLEVREIKKQTSTPEITPHERLCSPGVSPIKCDYMTPKEVYEMGMRKPKESWQGNSMINALSPRVNRTYKGHWVTLISPRFVSTYM